MKKRSTVKFNILVVSIALIIGAFAGYGLSRLSTKLVSSVAAPVIETKIVKAKPLLVVSPDTKKLEDKIKQLDITIDKLIARNTKLQNEITASDEKEEIKPVLPQEIELDSDNMSFSGRALTVFNQKGELTDYWIEKTGMDSDDAERVQKIIIERRNDIRDLELANAEVKYASDDEIIITVSPFADKAGEVLDGLITDLGTILDEDYLAELKEGLNKPSRRSPYTLGTMKRDINIRIEESDDGDVTYVIKENSTSSGSADSSSPVLWSMSSRSVTPLNDGATPSISVMSSSGGFSSYSTTTRTKELPEAYQSFLPEN